MKESEADAQREPELLPQFQELDIEPSELCRMPRGHECWIRCDERTDTHYEKPQLAVCPLCKTDKPELTWNQERYPEIFCRSCGIRLVECDIPSLIKAWNTRSRPTVATPQETISAHFCSVGRWRPYPSVLCSSCKESNHNNITLRGLTQLLNRRPTVEAAEIRRQAFDEMIELVRNDWLAAYPLNIFPEPPPPPAECARDLIAAAMGRHMATRLIEQFEAARDAAPIPSENDSGIEATEG